MLETKYLKNDCSQNKLYNKILSGMVKHRYWVLKACPKYVNGFHHREERMTTKKYLTSGNTKNNKETCMLVVSSIDWQEWTCLSEEVIKSNIGKYRIWIQCISVQPNKAFGVS